MNRRLSKLTAPAALVLAAALTLSACGGDKDDSGTTSGSSSKISRDELTRDNFASTITQVQAEAETSHVSMDLGLGGQSIKAEGDVEIGDTAADTAMAMTMDMGASGMGELDMRLVDEVFYLNFGQMTQNKFAKIDLNDTSNPIGKQYSQLLDQMDPSAQLEQFDKAMTSFEKKGDAKKIDGVDAQPYEVVLDTSKVAGMSELPGGASASVPKELTYVMYVGPDNLPRRITTDVSGSKVQIDYSKWGEDVEIDAPSADQVSDQDLSEMMGGAGAASS